MSESVLTEPLTPSKMQEMQDVHGEVTGVVIVDLGEVINRDLERFMDMLSTKLTNTDILENIHYEVVGHNGDELHIKVTGDAAGILDSIHWENVAEIDKKSAEGAYN